MGSACPGTPKIRLLGALGASCGALGGVLGHLGSKSQHNHQKTDSLDPPGPPKLEPRSTRNSLKLVPEASQRVMIFFIDFWVRLWWHLVPTWVQQWLRERPQTNIKNDSFYKPGLARTGKRVLDERLSSVHALVCQTLIKNALPGPC